jgi:glycosyltransferase involved in cell wall biosynthesis
VVSIVIPAHNEARVIGRCLAALVKTTCINDTQIIVVANGCTDATADRARSFRDVEVLETPTANKAAALNMGDQHAVGFPRFYVDADIELTIGAVRGVASVLERDDVLVAAPSMVVDLTECPWSVRAFYEFWGTLPYAKSGHLGGAYGMSETGRSRFDVFPDAIADDFFIRSHFTPREMTVVRNHHFTVHPPKTLRSLVKVRSRVLAGNGQLRQQRPEGLPAVSPRPFRSVVTRPRLWPEAAIYTGVYAAARIRAEWKLRYGDVQAWERDETTRAGVDS